MNIIQDFIPSGRRNRPGIKLTGPHYITIHDTANPSKGADALAHAKYLKSDAAANLPVSWHFTVDDKRIVQHLPLDEVGWHAGDGSSGPGNRSSIAIEICENSDGDRAKAEETAAWLVADLLRRFNIGLDRVVQHNKWTGKHCPHILRDRPGGWEGFLAAVQKYLWRPENKPPSVGFRDVPANHWASDAIRAVAEAGIMRGYADGTFRPDAPLTRAEAAVVISKIIKR